MTDQTYVFAHLRSLSKGKARPQDVCNIYKKSQHIVLHVFSLIFTSTKNLVFIFSIRKLYRLERSSMGQNKAILAYKNTLATYFKIAKKITGQFCKNLAKKRNHYKVYFLSPFKITGYIKLNSLTEIKNIIQK